MSARRAHARGFVVGKVVVGRWCVRPQRGDCWPIVGLSMELPSPAATVKRRAAFLGAVFTKANQVAATDSFLDEDWDPPEDDSEVEDARVSNVGRGRVRLHAVQQQRSRALLCFDMLRMTDVSAWLRKGATRREETCDETSSSSGSSNLEKGTEALSEGPAVYSRTASLQHCGREST